MKLTVFLRLIRVKHYLKNVLVLLPVVFSGKLFAEGFLSSDQMIAVLAAFLSFCSISSVVYIMNDLSDIEQDKLHETKKYRPLASGNVSKNVAYLVAVCLLLMTTTLVSLLANPLLGGGILITYLLMNLAYSKGLKNIPLVDMAILVSGFLLRVVFGGIATNIPISHWMYLTIISLSFYLGLGKRRNELIGIRTQNSVNQTSSFTQVQTRKVLQHYSQAFLDKNMYMCLALSVVFYSLWAVDPLTMSRLHTDALIWTVPLVILLMMRYSMIVESESDGDPVEVILGDKMLLVMVLLFAAIILVILVW